MQLGILPPFIRESELAAARLSNPGRRPEEVLTVSFRPDEMPSDQIGPARVGHIDRGVSDRRAQMDSQFELTGGRTVQPEDVRQLCSNPVVPS
jgi:hypothetical protein